MSVSENLLSYRRSHQRSWSEEERGQRRVTLELRAGRGLGAASRKRERLFCKSMRDPAPHHHQGHHPELHREPNCLGEENRFLRFSPFYAAVTSSADPATPPGCP